MDAQSEVSVCCGAERLHPDMDLCPSCMEHTSFEKTDFWEVRKNKRYIEIDKYGEFEQVNGAVANRLMEEVNGLIESAARSKQKNEDESFRADLLVRQGAVQPMQTAESLGQKIKEFADIYGLECPNNDGNSGTIAEHGCNGTPEDCERTCPIPVQCEFCYTEPRSKFNLINDLKEMIGGLSA